MPVKRWNYSRNKRANRYENPTRWFDRLPPRFQLWSLTIMGDRYLTVVEHRHGQPAVIDTVWGPSDRIALSMVGQPLRRVTEGIKRGCRMR